MEIGFIVGIVVAFGAVLATALVEGASITGLVLPGPLLLVFGATIGVGFAGSTVKDVITSFKDIPRALKGKQPRFEETIETLVSLADTARREGLMKLEDAVRDSTDEFLKSGIQAVVDGKDSEDMAEQLEEIVHNKTKRDHLASNFFAMLGGYAPTIGIIGTVVSLTHVLENLSTPNKLGPLIAAAFVATLWGLVSANFIWLPLSTRLRRISDLEVENMNLVIEGVLAIQGGISARALSERLEIAAAHHKKDKGATKGEGDAK